MDDSDLVRRFEGRGKYPRNGRISMNIRSGTDSSGALGQNVFENNNLA